MARCENCGTGMSGGFCPNCDEEVFIADQYRDLEMPLPGEETQFMQNYNKSMGERSGTLNSKEKDFTD